MSRKRPSRSRKKLLVAGIGNRLMSDDGFGPRVIDLLSSTSISEQVDLRDFGTAGLTIATDLADYDVVIFIDSMEMEGKPGHLINTECKVEEGDTVLDNLARMSLHEVGLEGLLRFSKAIGTLPSKVILVGCKPKILTPGIELSNEVGKAAHRAVELVLDTVNESLKT